MSPYATPPIINNEYVPVGSLRFAFTALFRSFVTMAEGTLRPASVIFILFSLILIITGQVLTPPTFNLAKGRAISATATCGYEDAEPGPGFVELYCRLTGATGTTEDDIREIIQVLSVTFYEIDDHFIVH